MFNFLSRIMHEVQVQAPIDDYHTIEVYSGNNGEFLHFALYRDDEVMPLFAWVIRVRHLH